MGTAAADAAGRFALDVPGDPGARPRAPDPDRRRARAGLAAVDLKADAERRRRRSPWRPRQPVEGRLVDVQGQPAAGVVVRVARLGSSTSSGPTTRRAREPLAVARDDRRRRPVPHARHRRGAQATYEVEDPRYARQAFSFHVERPVGEGRARLRRGDTMTLRPAQARRDPRRPRRRRPAGGRRRIDIQSEQGQTSDGQRGPCPDRRPGSRAGRRLAGRHGTGSTSIRPRASRTSPPGATSSGPRRPCGNPSR